MVTVIAIMLPIALITAVSEKIYDLIQIILEKRELRCVFNGRGTY